MKTTVRVKVAVSAALVAVSAFGGGLTVSDSACLQMGESGTLTASAPALTELPSGLGTPLFWLDASMTNGWEFGENGEVKKIPSRGEITACLSSEVEGCRSIGWLQYMMAPVWHEVDDHLGFPSVDFGEIGSRRGLVFTQNGSDVAYLSPIGTVCCVYDSRSGGGWFLGGGPANKLYQWNRSHSDVRVDIADCYYFNWYVPLFESYADDFVNGLAWHDGLPTMSKYNGFAHRWEVLSVVPNNGPCCTAMGLGINDARVANCSGGMRIAEMIIFPTVLSDADRRRVEAYLSAKWFGEARRGWNGHAEIAQLHVGVETANATSMAVTSEVPSGVTLAIDRLTGGRGPLSSFTKRGAGTLAVGASSQYGATVKVDEGTLEFPRRARAASLPGDAYVHFDASARSSIVSVNEGGVDYVASWSNLTGEKFKGQDLYAESEGGTRPRLVANALGDGADVVDFGAFGTDGAWMRFVTNAQAAVELNGMVTVIAVVDAREGGGHLVGRIDEVGTLSGLRRERKDLGGSHYHGLLQLGTMTNPTYSMTNGVLYVDGHRAVSEKGYPSPGWHVMAVEVPVNNISFLGKSANYCGGFRLAELVMWPKVLTDLELRDASAYLAARWLKRDLPGYEKCAARVQGDVQRLEVADGAEVSVSGAGTARVGELVARGKMVKKGAGTFEARMTSESDDGELDVREGAFVAIAAPDAVSGVPAAEPTFWLDAANAAAMDLVSEGGVNYVKRWHDAGGSGDVAWNEKTANMPFLNDADDARLNGKAVVDFGAFRSAHSLHFSRSRDGVRAIYLVYGEQGRGSGYPTILGSTNQRLYVGSYQNCTDFLRDAGGGLFHYSQTTVRNYLETDGFLVNGEVKKDALGYRIPDGEYVLIELHVVNGVSVSALGSMGLNYLIDGNGGGQRYGEILLYDRPLSARERVATRNYLLKKWFAKTDAELAELPVEESPETHVTRLSVATDAAAETHVPLAVGELAGAGAVSVAGAGVLAVANAAGFSGSVDLAGGTLDLSGGSIQLSDLSGAGAVTNGTFKPMMWTIPFSDGACGTLQAAGATVDFAAVTKVRLTGLDSVSNLPESSFVVVRGGECLNVDTLNGATVEADVAIPAENAPRFKVSGGNLVLTFRPRRGMVLIVR